MNFKLNDEILPLGSVIKTKNSKINYTILGYLPSDKGKIYDYFCIKGKTGLNRDIENLRQDKEYFYVNNSDIEDLLFLGYYDDNFKLLKYIIKKIKVEFSSNKTFDDKDVARFVEKLKGELKNGI